MTQQQLIGSTVEVDDDRARAHEVDLTPTPVVRQLFEGLSHQMELGCARRFLDPSAGAGVFGMVARETFPHFLSLGIEPRQEEIENLAAHYDNVLCCTLEESIAFMVEPGPYDLITTNPPFSQAIDFVRILAPLLSPTGSLWLLQLDDFGQRNTSAGVQLFSEYRPTHQLRIPGAIGFRGEGSGTDSRSYSWWGWAKEDMGLSRYWHCENLPLLPACDRKWSVRPGEEWRNT